MSFIQPDNATELYVSQMQAKFQELTDQLQEHVQHVDDTEAKALFEKSAKVLSGLADVFADFYRKKDLSPQSPQNLK